MHRIRLVLILVMSAFLLFGCSSESPHTEILSGETDAAPVVYPVDSSDFGMTISQAHPKRSLLQKRLCQITSVIRIN